MKVLDPYFVDAFNNYDTHLKTISNRKDKIKELLEEIILLTEKLRENVENVEKNETLEVFLGNLKFFLEYITENITKEEFLEKYVPQLFLKLKDNISLEKVVGMDNLIEKTLNSIRHITFRNMGYEARDEMNEFYAYLFSPFIGVKVSIALNSRMEV